MFDNSDTHCVKDLTSLPDPSLKPYPLCPRGLVLLLVLRALVVCARCIGVLPRVLPAGFSLHRKLAGGRRALVHREVRILLFGTSTCGRLGPNGYRAPSVYLYCALMVVTCAGAYGKMTLGKHIGTASAFCVPVNCALWSPVGYRCEKRHVHVNVEGGNVDRMVLWMYSCRITKLVHA